jgi:hypothetical protein
MADQPAWARCIHMNRRIDLLRAGRHCSGVRCYHLWLIGQTAVGHRLAVIMLVMNCTADLANVLSDNEPRAIVGCRICAWNWRGSRRHANAIAWARSPHAASVAWLSSQIAFGPIPRHRFAWSV